MAGFWFVARRVRRSFRVAARRAERRGAGRYFRLIAQYSMLIGLSDMTPAEGPAQCLCASDDLNRRFGDIDKLVERWNYRAQVGRTLDRENYLNGDIEFCSSILEEARGSPLLATHGRDIPNDILLAHAEGHSSKSPVEMPFR
jgi:hypothetical protein